MTVLNVTINILNASIRKQYNMSLKSYLIENDQYYKSQLKRGMAEEGKEHINVYNLFKDFIEKHKLTVPISKEEYLKMITKPHLDKSVKYYEELEKLEKKLGKRD
jgi:hypothetical protein